MNKTLPPPIQELIDHLRTTGTGEAKLAKLAAVGMKCEDGKEFMLAAKEVVPDVTWKKIEAYVDLQKKNTNADPITGDTTLSQNDDEEEESIEDETTDLIEDGLPTDRMNAEESIKAIHDGKFDKEQLEVIAAFDTRTTVQSAAKKKLG